MSELKRYKVRVILKGEANIYLVAKNKKEAIEEAQDKLFEDEEDAGFNWKDPVYDFKVTPLKEKNK